MGVRLIVIDIILATASPVAVDAIALETAQSSQLSAGILAQWTSGS